MTAVCRIAAVLLILGVPVCAHSQTGDDTGDTTIDTTVEAGEADGEVPKRRLVKWNEMDGPVSTLRFGFGFLVDGVAYAQDDDSKAQFDLDPDIGLRDFRLLFSGKFKTERPLTWTLGYMYDGADDQWRFRQTGVMVGVPEVSGKFFVGRTKEGFSLIKVMTGYYIWGVERAPSADAFVPILADGIKYLGYFPKSRIFVNLGFFTDLLTENEKFATADRQFVWRLGWHPILSEEAGRVWQVAAMGREFKPDEGRIQQRSRPEAYLAPYFLDSGSFESERGRTLGVETFYRAGSWLVGGEYDWQQLQDDTGGGDAHFHGGTVVVVHELTGETRPYNVAGSYFDAIVPDHGLFEGGIGNLEAALTATYTDMDSGRFQGGTFWRVSPMIHWNMAYNLRLSLEYGYGKLERFDLKGTTQFFQFRILTML